MRLSTIKTKYVLTSIAFVGGTYFLYKLYKNYYKKDKDGVIVNRTNEDIVFCST